MKQYEYQRSRSFIDLGPGHSDSVVSNFFSSITSRLIEAKVHGALPWDGGMVVSSIGSSHMTKSHAPHMVKIFKNFLITLKIGMLHSVHVLKYYQLCPNDDPGLTFTIFMTGSDLFPNASAWEKAYIALSAHVFLNLF